MQARALNLVVDQHLLRVEVEVKTEEIRDIAIHDRGKAIDGLDVSMVVQAQLPLLSLGPSTFVPSK